jgi:ClpA/ClpB-like protein
MTTRTKTLASLLAVAVVLSSGAYALGSQAGGGGALASGSGGSGAPGNAATGATAISTTGTAGHRFRGGPGGPGFDSLAAKLGVTPAALQSALQAIRDEKTPQQRRTELVQAFATALGKPADQVSKALDSVLPAPGPGAPADHRGDFAAAIAKALGVDQAKVQAGLDKVRQDLGKTRPDRSNGRRFDRSTFENTIVGDIASATGVDAAKVRSTLQSLRPRHEDHRGPGAFGDVRQKLATALGVTAAQLDAAFQKVATQARDQFATELAQKLNIDVQKVKDALPDVHGGFGFGFGRRHG